MIESHYQQGFQDGMAYARAIAEKAKLAEALAETDAETMRKQPCPETAMVPRSGLEPELTRNGILSPGQN
jgi:hypothetical protein